jgi:hypothetical protein
MTFEVDLKMNIRVQFTDEAKIKEFFIDGDWKEHFQTFHEVSEVAQHLAYCFGHEMHNPEGFGNFEHKYEEGYYVSEQPEEYGTIYIKIVDELDVDYCGDDGNDIVECV